MTPKERVVRLCTALMQASSSPEYVGAAASRVDSSSVLWNLLAEITLRDGLKSNGAIVDEMPVDGIPGFRETNKKLRKLGYAIEIVIDSETKRVTEIHLVDEIEAVE